MPCIETIVGDMGSPLAHGEKKGGVAEDDDDDTDSSIVMTSVVDNRSERSDL